VRLSSVTKTGNQVCSLKVWINRLRNYHCSSSTNEQQFVGFFLLPVSTTVWENREWTVLLGIIPFPSRQQFIASSSMMPTGLKLSITSLVAFASPHFHSPTLTPHHINSETKPFSPKWFGIKKQTIGKTENFSTGESAKRTQIPRTSNTAEVSEKGHTNAERK
jgi:hypothetical protein